MSPAHFTADLVRAMRDEHAVALDAASRRMRDESERADSAERLVAKLRADIDAIESRATAHAASMYGVVAEILGAPDPVHASHSSLRLALFDAKRELAAVTAERDALRAELAQRRAA